MILNKKSPPTGEQENETEKICTFAKKCIKNAVINDLGSSGEIEVDINPSKNLLLVIPVEPCQFSVDAELYNKLYDLLSVVLYPILTLRKTSMQLVETGSDDISTMRAFAFPYITGTVKRISATKDKLLAMRDGNKIPITQGLSWDYRKYSHAIITGMTGSGKSYYLGTLLEQLNDIDESTIIIVDPKISDAARWAKNKEYVKLIIPDLSNNNGISNAFLEKINDELNTVEKVMYERQADMFENASETSKSYPDKPIFVFIDELASLSAKDISKPLVNEFWAHLSRICLLGREANINLIVSLQKPLNTYIDTALREQFSLKMTLGPSTLSTLKLLFDDLDSMPFVPNLNEKGVGIVSIGGSNIQPVATPTIINKEPTI
ncbi:hypothetical protein AKUG0803_UNKNOWN200060 (plasmid) [Apilactobacillus kunkeei]|nr:hypothetical protein AKUG0804_UNKNOWN200060 [Apilactobacillus kunkeei]CAI2672558.1 hypothetical protein AKUG0405_UNKNOWN200060 [Apilactobacillus kunkeei]CAI2674391.1 hypothetical protein AKUG0103_UNKNOWN200060 [Apilactobacillus kunkeei]CAI2674892.1 hypothetical protein AKUG0803_UNKNOWN200060 [Apilactobacillus kunkeei]CAI2676742.1 hypothetical protein AKUG0402_UNKNOWN200060 [Apilactobacillus kunkeei]